MGINELLQVGSRIKKIRKEKGYTQKNFAKEIGVTYSTYSNYENNNRVPNAETLHKIADALGVTVGELLGTAPRLDLDSDIAFFNYLESIGYEIHEASDLPDGIDWAVYLKNVDSNIYLSDQQLTDFHNDINEYVHLKIMKLQVDQKKG